MNLRDRNSGHTHFKSDSRSALECGMILSSFSHRQQSFLSLVLLDCLDCAAVRSLTASKQPYRLSILSIEP